MPRRLPKRLGTTNSYVPRIVCAAAVSTDLVQRIRTKRHFTTRLPSPLTESDEKFWSYDLRTNQRFTLKEKTLKRSDLAMTVISVLVPAQATGKQW
jgi:hypothetical protein